MSPTATLVALLTVATCGFLLAYLLVCLAAPVFLNRIGELTWPAVMVSAVVVPILLAVLVTFVITNPATTYPLAALTAVGVAGYGWLRRRRRTELGGIGVYDETTTADVLIPGSSAA
jgi:amino acid transporter